MPDVGHNLPPLDDASKIDVDLQTARIREKSAETAARLNELIDGLLAVPPEIATDAEARKAISFMVQCADAMDTWEQLRKSERAPVLALGAAVQDFYTPVAERVMALMDRVLDSLSAFNEAHNAKGNLRGVYGGTMVPGTDWDIVLQNIHDVPTAYLKLDESKVKKSIAAGVVTIPGLKLTPHHKVHVRP